MSQSFDAQRTNALRYIGELQAACASYTELLNRAGNIRPDTPGEPFWLMALRRSYEELVRSLQVASAKAELPPRST
jgi:hypothetical protein